MTGHCVALITARGGSKRLPRKNALPLAGLPLIAWTIKAALEAETINRVMVSTDDPELMEISAKAGAEVPFRRPQELSGDKSNHYDVVEHALTWLEQDEGRPPDMVVLLQPTSPLRNGADIDGLVRLVDNANADSGFTVGPVQTHPAHVFRVDESSRATPLYSRGEGYVRTQDLEPLYCENGAAYVIRPPTFRTRSTILGECPVAHIMPPERSIDIDTALDLAIAAALIDKRGTEERQSATGG